MADDKNRISEYFAAKPAEECAGIVLNKADSFYNYLRSNAITEKWYRMYRFYHGSFTDDYGFGHSIEFSGEQGELTVLPVNHFRNLAQHIYVMITANRPVMEARAINTDYKSMAQTYLANGVLDYYMREKGLENSLKKAAEMAIVMGSGYIKMEWNATAGEAYDVDPDTGEFNYEGEVEFSNLSPYDVVFDGTRESWDHDWLLVRTFKNRYDLMAKYPELADKISGIPTKSEKKFNRMATMSNDSTDDVEVYEFYHKRSEALPDGRYILFLDSNVVLLDTKLPYRSIPIFRIAPSDVLGTSYGYTPMFDVFPIQEGINALYSTIMSNQATFGVQNLYVPRGADINVNNLEGGFNVIEGNAKPEPLNLTETPAEVFKFLDMLIQASETISGVNSVARGNPEPSLKSGTALALVQSMSLQFISGLQQSYVKLIEDSGTSLINMLKDFAHTPKVVALVGKNNRSYLKEFTGEQIDSINRVVVDVGNPLSRTVAGRVQMAEQMLQMNMLKTPEQYFQVMNTGRLDAVFEGEMSELLNIKAENEKLLEGTPVTAVMLDPHRMHIMEHKSVLADPDLRMNQELVKNTLEHIQQHIDYLRNTDPALLAMIGEQSLSVPQQQAGPQAPEQNQGAASDVLSNPQAQTATMQSGEQITGPGLESSISPARPASPPPPFDSLPVTADQVIPQ
jgi:hypothetical protein